MANDFKVIVIAILSVLFFQFCIHRWSVIQTIVMVWTGLFSIHKRDKMCNKPLGEYISFQFM